jgi:membrane protein insertase Oxa1/YidC/SpoIIIJ
MGTHNQRPFRIGIPNVRPGTPPEQIHAQRRMQLIQPEMRKIQKKYKGKTILSPGRQ